MIKTFLLFITFGLMCGTTNAQSFSGVKSLARRRVPWIIPHLKMDSIASESGKDVFVLQSVNGKINISASNSVAAAKGLYYYLTNYCHRSMSHLGDNLSAVKRLPVVEQPIKVASPFRTRYALNYCTISYSMAFYSWKQWEHELDWMAFNGVNLMLAPVGTEIIWQKVLQQYGLSEKEIAQFIPGPAYTAWWLMGNMEGWGGPISPAVIERQKKLQVQILDRMRALGIQPVLQGFYGMVPASLKEKYTDWKIVVQGKWAGGFRRPDILLPTDPHFAKMAASYYKTLRDIYGNDIHFFAGEPFHEGGITKGIDVPACAAAIQQNMLQNVPNSTWVLQGWQNNPTDKLLAQLDRNHVLIQELFGENTQNWYQRKGYNETPFIWCSVTNFGEKQGLYGKLQRFANEIYRAQTSVYSSTMKGIGIMPEGIVNNPVVYDLILDLGWQKDSVDVAKWLPDFVKARYGNASNELQTAWQIFLKTIYSSPKELQEGPEESVFCARPSLHVGSVSSWGTRKRNYDPVLFSEGVKTFLSLKNKINTETYKTDVVDFTRQLLANKGENWYAQMITAFEKKDSIAFKAAAQTFLTGVLQQDSLLSLSPLFQLHTWLKSATDCVSEIADKAVFLHNAKAQITYWGPDNNKETDLHEYAHKEWNGMMRNFYYPRWQMFVSYCMGQLRGHHPAEPDYYAFETSWAKGKSLYPVFKLNTAEQTQLIKRILSE